MEVFCKKYIFKKSCKIFRKPPVPESRFKKVVGLQNVTLLKRGSNTGFSLLILLNFLKQTE